MSSNRPRFLRNASLGIRALALAAALGLGVMPARAQVGAPTEYQVEAAFLYNFAKYVTWPPRAFASATEPFIIGVLGEDPFGDDLVRTIEKEKQVQGRPLVIVRGRTPAEVANCHVLFISASEQPRLAQDLAALQRAGSTALTVGESDDFLVGGGMIRFVIDNSKVRFEINARAAEQSGLVISSKLLSLARNNPRPRS